MCLIKCNLNHTETLIHFFFVKLIKNLLIFWVNFITAAVLMHLAIKAETLMVS